MIKEGKLGNGHFETTSQWSQNDLYINEQIPVNASYKAKKYEFDQNLKEYLEYHITAAWKIVYVDFDNLSSDLAYKLGNTRLAPNKGNRPFSSYLIKDELSKLFEIADKLIDGWSFYIRWHGAAYKSSATLIITFSFTKEYTDAEGDARRAKEQEALLKRQQQQKAAEDFKLYIKKVKDTYKLLGYQNSWKDDDKRYSEIGKAIKDKAVTVYNIGRGENIYISDKYKIYWYVDSTD